jgi:hypothetical protein
MGVHCETGELRNFGPTVLVPWAKEGTDVEVSQMDVSI